MRLEMQSMQKPKERVIFDIEKLKQGDEIEIKRVARHYADRDLTNKQVAYIAYNAKAALDAIQIIAREICKSQEYGFSANSHSTSEAFSFSSKSQKKANTAEERRDAYAHSERVHRHALDAQERINKENNSTWKVVATVTSVAISVSATVIAVAAYVKKK